MRVGKKNYLRDELLQNLIDHILDISSGKCSIDDRMILNIFEKDKTIAEILSGLRFLYETLSFQNECLKEHTEKIISIQEEERLALSRDIHDDLGQLLAVMKIGIFSLGKKIPDDSELRENFLVLEDILNKSIQSLRNISSNLRGHELINLGLSGAIENHLLDKKKYSNINFIFFNKLSDIRIDKKIEMAIFRIFQEALTNVIKHAQANQVSVSLLGTKKDVSLKIEDNGKGIELEDLNKDKSFGIKGMRERANLYGGSVSIFNRAGKKGTCVKASLPALFLGKGAFV